MLLVYRHTLIVLYICLCIACFAGNIVWALLLFGASTSNTSPSVAAPTVAAPTVAAPTVAAPTVAAPTVAVAVAGPQGELGGDGFNDVSSKSTEYIITIKNDVSLQLLKVVCIILNAIVIPLLIYFFYTYRKTWW